MCPVSGFVQFLMVLISLIVIFEIIAVNALKVSFESKNVTIDMYNSSSINYTVNFDDVHDTRNVQLKLFSNNDNIASAEKIIWLNNTKGSFNISGNFLGRTKVLCKSVPENRIIPGSLDVIVIRKKRPIDHIFTGSVIILVSIIYINFGCALKWDELRTNLRRPIGPMIGFIGQFLVMPLLSFGIGKLLFPNNPEMQLGIFFTGVSPAGGASNIWTVVLDGNMDLSVTMTTISTLAAFAMMPFWIFTLGKSIFDHAKLTVPYSLIGSAVAGLIIPLAIGFLITRYLKRVAQFMARILKGFSAVLIIFIIVFAIVTNLYLFKLFSWQIIIAGMCLPYVGYILAFILAKLLKQPPADCLAIAIETGIQNTGIAIFLSRIALGQPEGDLTTVAPVSVAIMTPIPLMVMFIYKRLCGRISASKSKLKINKSSNDTIEDNNFNLKIPESLIDTVS